MASREQTYPGDTHSSELGAPVTPVPLMQIATGFWAFKTLAAAHELDLFTRLAGGAETTAQELARELGIEQRPAEMLLTGCASLGLLERGHHGYRNTALSERFLVRGTPYYFGGLVTMFDRRLYPGWAKLTEAIRTNRPTTWDPERQRSMFEREDPAVLETFWEAMHSMSGFTARTLGDAIDLDAATRLLDVGGGSGAFAIELCQRYPSLCATVFDLPHVIDIAADKIADAELRDRVAVHGGDFFADALPPGHDVHVYSMIMHDWNEEHDRLLLRKSFDALPNGGIKKTCSRSPPINLAPIFPSVPTRPDATAPFPDSHRSTPRRRPARRSPCGDQGPRARAPARA